MEPTRLGSEQSSAVTEQYPRSTLRTVLVYLVVILAHLLMSLLSQLLIWKLLWNSFDILLLKMILSVELVPPVHEN